MLLPAPSDVGRQMFIMARRALIAGLTALCCGGDGKAAAASERCLHYALVGRFALLRLWPPSLSRVEWGASAFAGARAPTCSLSSVHAGQVADVTLQYEDKVADLHSSVTELTQELEELHAGGVDARATEEAKASRWARERASEHVEEVVVQVWSVCRGCVRCVGVPMSVHVCVWALLRERGFARGAAARLSYSTAPTVA